MSKFYVTVETDRLIEKLENASDDYEYIDTMIHDFNKLYPMIKLEVVAEFDADVAKEYIDIGDTYRGD